MTIHSDPQSTTRQQSLRAPTTRMPEQSPALPGRIAPAYDRDTPAPYLPHWLRTAETSGGTFDIRRLGATWHYLIHPWHRVPKALLWWVGRGIRQMKNEVRCTTRGAGRVADGIARFCFAVDRERVRTDSAGTAHLPRASERLANARAYRRIILWVALGAVSIVGLWLGVYHPHAGVGALIGFLSLLSFLGHLGQPKSEAPPRGIQPLVLGRPTSLIEIDVRQILIEEGYEELITVDSVKPDYYQHAYIIALRAHTELKVDFLRQLERRLYAPPYSIFRKFDPIDASYQYLTVKLANPLVNVPEAPWLPAGSVSGWQPLDLGASANPDCPFELVLIMQHIIFVATTRGGKTTHMNNMIDRLSATRDVIVCAGASIKSSVFDSWRSVLHKKAQTIEEMVELLQWLINEINRRDRMIKRINSDDDPNNDIDKWYPSLGPAIVLMLDEFPRITEYDGTKLYQGEKINLLELVEYIMSTGAGLGISIIAFCQASGNDQWGSSTIIKNAAIKILGPCSERDTVDILGKNRRDEGYAPHLLKPADPTNDNDAGMATVDAAGFGPEYVRGYAPFKVKARALRREQEWADMGNRPMLPLDSEPELAIVMDAETLPTCMAIVDAALKHHNARILNSVLVIAYAVEHHGEQWTATTLPKALRDDIPGNADGDIIRPRNGHCDIKKKVVKSYHREDVHKAMTALEAVS